MSLDVTLCRSIINKLRKEPNAHIFEHPVDEVKDQAPGEKTIKVAKDTTTHTNQQETQICKRLHIAHYRMFNLYCFDCC